MTGAIRSILAAMLCAGLVVLAVANRGTVSLTLDPFATDASLAFELPLYLVIFGAVAVGIIIGGLATRRAPRQRNTGRRPSPSALQSSETLTRRKPSRARG